MLSPTKVWLVGRANGLSLIKNFPLNEFITINKIGAKNTTTNAQSIRNITVFPIFLFGFTLTSLVPYLDTATSIIVLPPYF